MKICRDSIFIEHPALLNSATLDIDEVQDQSEIQDSTEVQISELISQIVDPEAQHSLIDAQVEFIEAPFSGLLSLTICLYLV